MLFSTQEAQIGYLLVGEMNVTRAVLVRGIESVREGPAIDSLKQIFTREEASSW